MVVEDKYLKLLNLLIYDKRNNMNGIITDLLITSYVTGVGISYSAYFTKICSDRTIFVDDFEKGNIVFLIPFGIDFMVDVMDKMADMHVKAIKDFFGDKFRDDMIIRISEEERKKQIRKSDELILGLENWDKVIQ